MSKRGITAQRLVEFHTCHKPVVLAHGRQAYRDLGRHVARAGEHDTGTLSGGYTAGLMAALKKPATRKGHADVLQHLEGYLKAALDNQDKAELGELLEEYRLVRVPLIGPITLLRHHFRKYPNAYARGQVYLQPHPRELMLRNLI